MLILTRCYLHLIPCKECIKNVGKIDYTFFFIRNRFIRNWTSARQKNKKLQGWSRGDLRNFQIEKIKKLNRDKKKES